MILKDLLNHFEISCEFPEYLLELTFNEVFLDGDLTKTENDYKIAVTTRQDVTHQMFLKPDDDYPVVIMSILPNGKLNGMKFARKKGQVAYINEV
ncbi:MAG: hypothetical protein IJL02_01500 [Methanobrevibacter sp.]|uniref:hypothetical protein n=1 Tax=Methanobrevibacter sp. TaxID=66852 RepID=UPI0025EC87DD|nr:hypothetical protein [Methanobrevibacter sp.]MBQ6098523.1 hypothetical protein [Methanobrevibacter sp.]